MKYIKSYESLFDLMKDPPEKVLDREVIMDLLRSDLDGLNIFDTEVLENIYLDSNKQYFGSYKDGNPKMYNDTFFGYKVEYASSPTNIPFGINLRAVGVLMIVDQSPERKSINKLDIREQFFLTYKTLDKINKKRMREYGIGCCLFDTKNSYNTILFYPI